MLNLPLTKPRVMVVHQDPQTTHTLQRIGARDGYDVSIHATLSEAADEAQTRTPDLLLVDLPLEHSSDRARTLLTQTAASMIVISAQDSTEEVRAAFAAGAEDYVRKPFDPEELRARLRVALRARGTTNPHRGSKPFTIIVEQEHLRLVLPTGITVPLTPLEARVIRRLLVTPDVAVPREALLHAGWSRNQPSSENALEACIRRLRLKIEENPEQPRWLQTQRSQGYTLCTAH